jgi:vacuolar-type H+-ATPase subunit H
MPQAERVILEAEDEVTPVVSKANAGLASFEQKAESSHGKVIRITDQTRSSIQRLIASLEKQAETYGKSGVDRLITQRDSLLQRYAKEPQAIDAITRAYERMIETQKKADAEAMLEKQARSMESFGERVTRSIENPVQGASSAVGSLLTKIGPLGIGLAAGATVMTGLAVATFEAAKSLGEFGVQVKDAELRTGLTSKEVGQFGFAARAVGQDVTIFERLMRGLTNAVEDTGKEGEKARTWLTRFGVDIQGVRTGMVPTSEVLLQVSKGLEGLPPGFDRTRVAMDLFKRAGIEAIPVMDGLRERVDHAKSLGFGITESDVKKYEELNQKAVEFEMKWESAIRSVKAMLVDLASAFGWVLDKIATKPPTPSKASLADQQQHAARVAALETQGQAALEAQQKALQQQMDKSKPTTMDWLKTGLAGFGAYVGVNIPTGGLSSSAQQWGQSAAQLQYLKEALDALAAKPQPHAPLAEPPTGGTGESALDSAMRQARRELAGLAGGEDRFAAIAAERQEAINDAMEKFKGKAGPLVEILKQVYDAKWLKEYNTEQERTSKELDEQSRRWDELMGKSAKASGAPFREDIAEGTKKLEEQSKAVAKLAAEWVKLRETGESQALAHTKRMISITGNADDPLGILKAQQALELGQVAQTRQAALGNLSTNPIEAIEQRAVAEKQAANAVGELRYQWEEKVAEVRKKADQEQQEMLDKQEKAIEKIAEKLFDTLFTKPKDFGKDLAKTVHQQVLKPVVEGVSGMAANVLHPVIYGEDGKGGLAGIFKGLLGGGKPGDPVKVSTDQNTAATIQNSAHVAALTAVLAGVMGVSAPAIAASAIPGVSLPSISAPAVSIPTRIASPYTGSGGVGGSGAGAVATVTAVAAPSFSDLANLPLNQDRIAQSLAMSGPPPSPPYSAADLAHLPTTHDPIAQILAMSAGGKLTGGGGASSIVSNLKGAVWNQKEFSALQGAGDSGFVSGLGAVAKSPAAGAAGMMLAESGLLGSHQGTWAGVGMGAAGGAEIGFQMGGPLGALIGGVAGFGIGMGEKLAGIESPQKKAHDDIKQIYGVDIPQNSGTIKQVVSIAQSQFGGDIAVAVRSPNVRQLVLLYSEATGQKMPLSASTPYAGSLVESGGNLYQQASFQNNAWHSYATNLPTLGGIAGTPYPTTPGPNTGAGTGSTYLSLNINGTPITADFVADQSMVAQNASYGRTQQSANLQVPGLMVA